MKNKGPLYRRLLDKGEKEARQHTKFLRSMLHGVAKEIAKELQVSIKKISQLQVDKINKAYVSIIVTIKGAISIEKIEELRGSLKKHQNSFALYPTAENTGFVVSWNTQARIGKVV